MGDLEIADPELDARLGLHFGDLVAFDGIDSARGRCFNPGHFSIGIVSHGPSPLPGHGTGITILLTGPAGDLQATVTDTSGISEELRRWTDHNG